MSKLRGMLRNISAFLIPTAKFVALMVPLLLLSGKAFAEFDNLDIKNATFAAKLDCTAATTSLLEQNGNVCVLYGKVASNPQLINWTDFTFQFQPYSSSGYPLGNQWTIRVGYDSRYQQAAAGSGQWVINNLYNIRTILIPDVINRLGSIVLKKETLPSIADGNWYLQASNAIPTNMPWGIPGGDPHVQKAVATIWRAHAVSLGLRKVTAYHVYHNGDPDRTVEVDWSNVSISQLETIRQKKGYTCLFGGCMWYTNYETEKTTDGVNSTKTVTGNMPASYTADGDEVTPVSQLSQTSCTGTNPCYASVGLSIITLDDGRKFHIGSKKFTKEQLDGIPLATNPDPNLQTPEGLQDAEKVFLPCPFAAYAMNNSGGMLMLKRVMQHHWKIEFNFVEGTSVYTKVNNIISKMGDFKGATQLNWVLGRPIARIANFKDINDNLIPTFGGTMDCEAKNAALVGDMFSGGYGGTIEYDGVDCSCFDMEM